MSTWLSLTKEIQTRACTKSRQRLFIAALFFSLWRQNAVYRGLYGLGHWQTVQIQIRRHKTRRLIRICTVCFNYKKLRVKLNSLKSPFRTSFPAYTQRHYWCQCFDIENVLIASTREAIWVTTWRNVPSDRCVQRWLKNQSAHPHNLISFCCSLEVTLHQWISKLRPFDILIHHENTPI